MAAGRMATTARDLYGRSTPSDSNRSRFREGLPVPRSRRMPPSAARMAKRRRHPSKCRPGGPERTSGSRGMGNPDPRDDVLANPFQRNPAAGRYELSRGGRIALRSPSSHRSLRLPQRGTNTHDRADRDSRRGCPESPGGRPRDLRSVRALEDRAEGSGGEFHGIASHAGPTRVVGEPADPTAVEADVREPQRRARHGTQAVDALRNAVAASSSSVEASDRRPAPGRRSRRDGVPD